jgi:hypothetical protein
MNYSLIFIPTQGDALFKPIAIAMLIEVARRADPPAETKGKGSPVIGNIPIFIPTWIVDSAKITQNTPITKALSELFVFPM